MNGAIFSSFRLHDPKSITFGTFLYRFYPQKKREYMDDYLFLCIFDLRKGGFLDVERFRFSLKWRDRSPQEFIVHVCNDRLVFIEQGESTPTWSIGLLWTHPHYGGRRPWFACPGCGSRVAKLAFTKGSMLCRLCLGTPAYLSKNGTDLDAVMDQIVKIRRHYGIVGLCGGTIYRPKLMRRKKFARVKARLEKLELLSDELYMRKA